MRLGQFSRKYEIKSNEVVEVLDKHFRSVNNHPNVKLTDEELAFLLTHFDTELTDEGQISPDTPLETTKKPEGTTSNLTESANDTEAEENQITDQETSLTHPKFEKDVASDLPSQTDTSGSIAKESPKVISLEKEYEEQTKDVETIKAEKPKLDGLKVLGKIDIPEPKEKIVKEEETEAQKKKVKESTSRNKRPRKSQKQTLSLEEQRKRKERLAWKKKQLEQKRLKEKRRKHYERQLQKKKEVQKATPLKKEKATTQVAEPEPKAKTTPTKAVKQNPIKSFWKWLNGAYDDI